jgi:hypothetical protein
MARRDPGSPAIAPLRDILAKHHATMKCQFDAFADYVAEAEKHGTENYPFMSGPKRQSESAKREKYIKSFTLYVDGNEVHAKEIADALESDLQPLVGGVDPRMTKHDTILQTTRSRRPAFADCSATFSEINPAMLAQA